MELSTVVLLLAQGLASHLFLAGVLVITVTLIYRTQRRLIQLRREYAQNTASLRTGRGGDAKLHTTTPLPSNLGAQWEVELHQVAREYLAQAQTQSAVLERQLREARALSEQLARQLEQFRRLQAELRREAARSGDTVGKSGAVKDRQPVASQGILEMAAQGRSAEQIAALVGRPQGEVELLLRLHQASQHQQPERESRPQAFS